MTRPVTRPKNCSPSRHSVPLLLTATLAASALTGCGDQASLPKNADTGPDPTLPNAKSSTIPTVNIAPARGWPEGRKPAPSPGLTVTAYATGLDHPRWLHVLPNGDVLVAETNGPERPSDKSGIKGWVMTQVQRRAGATSPSADRITLLRGMTPEGLAETKSPFLTGLHSPFGMALVGADFYVANTDAVLKFPYSQGAISITGAGVKLEDLPAGPINHHWTKDLVASPDGSKLYASVGSNSNVAENGIENEINRAAILEIDRHSGKSRVFASGLRNPNGLSWNPTTHDLWCVVNERDELGSDLVPDYMTSVKDGAFYGWPYSYYGQHIDTRTPEQKPDLVKSAIKPDYALGAHTASLGLTFNTSNALPARFAGGAFVGQHGSWNRIPLSGYKVVFIPFSQGRPSGSPQDVLTGFVDADGNAFGRPVGIAIDKTGALLVADDVGNTIWRVTAAPAQQTNAAPQQ